MFIYVPDIIFFALNLLFLLLLSAVANGGAEGQRCSGYPLDPARHSHGSGQKGWLFSSAKLTEASYIFLK
jgi:hypothetical protein